jgi:antirestriction protein
VSTPRIYVACLASYNNGRLHGTWIDAYQSAETIWTEVEVMLESSPDPWAEEWAIHDYEGFGTIRLGESEPFARVAAMAAGIVEYGNGVDPR